MARRTRVVANDFETLIAQANDELSKLLNDADVLKEKIKNQRLEIKKLEKAKSAYDAQLAEEAEARRREELVAMIAKSDKSFEEIEAFLIGKKEETKPQKTKVEKPTE